MLGVLSLYKILFIKTFRQLYSVTFFYQFVILLPHPTLINSENQWLEGAEIQK